MNRLTSDRPLRATLSMKMDCYTAGVMLEQLREEYPDPSPHLVAFLENLEISKTKNPDSVCEIEIPNGTAVAILLTGLIVLNQD